MMTNNPRIKLKLLPLAVIVMVCAFLGARFLLTYLTTAEVDVTTNTSNYISIVRLGTTTSSSPIAQGQGKLSARLHTGAYSIGVGRIQTTTQRTVLVHAHHNQHLSINTISVNQLESVTNDAAYDLVFNNNNIAFLDLYSRNLISIDDQNNEQLLNTGYSLTEVKWASPTYGVAQDQASNLYLVNSGSVSKLTIPQTVNNNNYAIAPNKDLYVSNGKVVYSGIPGSTMIPIFRSTQKISILGASNNGVLINISGTSPSGDTMVVISSTGKTYEATGKAVEAAWSPSGKYLVITSSDSTKVYSNQLKFVEQLPANDVTSPVWLGNNAIFYGVNNGVWRYSLAAEKADLLATTPSSNFDVYQLTLSQDDAYIYVLTQSIQSSNRLYVLSRLGLLNQPASTVVLGLQAFLPNTVDGCSIGYLNFSQPIVIAQPTDSPTLNCNSVAQTYLQEYGLDTASLKFETSP